ncbi:MAG: insulinase family protein [Armatimonadetes bacterium]|nr:insulinase family protein [Armatimonadota bacterium]
MPYLRIQHVLTSERKHQVGVRGKVAVRKVVLGNGLTLLIRSNHSTPIVAFQAYLRGGVRSELPSRSGLTHFTQRTLIKGTQTLTAQELAEETENLGSFLHSFTGKDTFGLSMTLLSKYVERGAEILADCIRNPRFDPEEVGKERNLIVAQIERNRDEFPHYTMDLCEKVIFARHPYRLSLFGEIETIGNLGRDDLIQWHKRYYVPWNLVIAVVGDIKADRAISVFDKAFGGFAGGPVHDKEPVREAPAKKARELIEERDKKQVSLVLGFRAASLGSPDYFACQVLNAVLSGMGSRLFIELRDKQGLAYSISSLYEARLDYGVFKAYMGTSPEQEVQAKEGLLIELNKVRQKTVGKDELDRARKYMLGLYEISLQRNSSQAARYALYEILGVGYHFLDEYPARVKEVTARQVKTAAEKYLDTDHPCIALVRPSRASKG